MRWPSQTLLKLCTSVPINEIRKSWKFQLQNLGGSTNIGIKFYGFTANFTVSQKGVRKVRKWHFSAVVSHSSLQIDSSSFLTSKCSTKLCKLTNNRNLSFCKKSIMVKIQIAKKNQFAEFFNQIWCNIIVQLQSDGYESCYFHKIWVEILLFGQKSGIWSILFKIY